MSWDALHLVGGITWATRPFLGNDGAFASGAWDARLTAQ